MLLPVRHLKVISSALFVLNALRFSKELPGCVKQRRPDSKTGVLASAKKREEQTSFVEELLKVRGASSQGLRQRNA